MMKVSLLLVAVNRATAPLAGVIRSLEKLGAVSRAVSRSVGGNMASMYDFTRDATAHFKQLAGEEGMGKAARSAAYLKSQVSGLTSGLSLLKYASVGAAIGIGEEFVRGVFHAGGEMDQMYRTLTKIEGSGGRARRPMLWMQNFSMGAGARYSMPQIMSAYQQAANFGMNPQGGSLAAFANLAAAEPSAGGLRSIMIAVTDAMQGVSTRPFKRLGISIEQGKKPGQLNRYSWADDTGHQYSATAAKNPQAVLATLLRIINTKYGGLAGEQAKTLPAGMAILQKKLFMFEALVASSGAYDWAIKRLNQFFTWIKKASADGSLVKWAKTISDFLTGTGDKVIAFVKTTDWAAVGRNLTLLGGSIVVLARALGMIANLGGGGLSGLFNLWIVSKIVGVGRALWGFKSIVVAAFKMLWPFVLRLGRFIPVAFEAIGGAIAGLAAIVGAPIEVVVVAIAALIGAGYLLWANWNRVTHWLSQAWNNLGATFGVLLGVLTGAPLFVMAAWKPLTNFFANLWARLPGPPAWITALGSMGTPKIATPVLKPGPARLDHALSAASSAAAARRGQGPVAVTRGESTLTIDFRNAPAGMRVRELRAHPGQEINVKRGPVQVGG